MPHPREEVLWQIFTAGTDKMTNARQMSEGEGGWERLELTEHYAYMCRRAHELYWTHNFFILDKGCPILTRRWCFFHRRQTVSYPRESGSHLALTSRCSSILAIGGFITRSWTRLSTSRLSGVEKVSRVHSTGKSLDLLSTTIWVGVGHVNWAHDLNRSLTSV